MAQNPPYLLDVEACEVCAVLEVPIFVLESCNMLFGAARGPGANWCNWKMRNAATLPFGVRQSTSLV